MVNNLRTVGKSEFERSNPPPTLSPNRSWNSIRSLGRRRKNPSHPVHHVVIITFTIPFFEVTFVEDLGHIAVPVTQVISILLHPCRSLRIIQPSSSTSAPCARPRARVVRVCVKKRRLRLAPAAKESATGVAMGSRSFVLIRVSPSKWSPCSFLLGLAEAERCGWDSGRGREADGEEAAKGRGGRNLSSTGCYAPMKDVGKFRKGDP